MKSLLYTILILILLNSLFFMKEMKANNVESFHFNYVKKIDSIPKDSDFLITMEFIYDLDINQCRKIFLKDNIASNHYNDCKDMVDNVIINQ